MKKITTILLTLICAFVLNAQPIHVIGSASYIDDDATPGENNDDWIRLNGYFEIKSSSDNYGIVLRDKDNSDYFGLTQKNGWSYLADKNTSSNYFLRGNGATVQISDQLGIGVAPNSDEQVKIRYI